jgi:hypothetical protein
MAIPHSFTTLTGDVKPNNGADYGHLCCLAERPVPSATYPYISMTYTKSGDLPTSLPTIRLGVATVGGSVFGAL